MILVLLDHRDESIVALCDASVFKVVEGPHSVPFILHFFELLVVCVRTVNVQNGVIAHPAFFQGQEVFEV